ncbi:MAG: outer membrane receptor for Fe3+-dicitrate [Cyclobacteriaceae bacterium]|jgi:outer membrane receptor for Fe3+-dicitrate
MKRFEIFISSILIMIYSLHGQSPTLGGRITDIKNVPLQGAYVIHQSSEHHAHTNEAGYFVLPGVKAGDTLQITHIGFDAQQVIIANIQEPLDLTLKEIPFELGEIVVSRSIDALNIVSRIDIELNPVNSSQEILRKVPGLFIGQHAGGGKAEQLFLRGFDIDHGTDVSITIDGMPVNMVSHAHGQGYADLHWLIPETIDKLDFGKGPYNAEEGNFATAGYVNFKTKDRLDQSSITLQGGSFGQLRTVGMFNVLDEKDQNAYIAAEYLYTDGPFESSQYFNRLNLMGKYNLQLKRGGDVSVSASHFSSTWDASGQIPERAVRSGQISRFGALDDTEGGSTSRTNFALNHTKVISDELFIKNKAYLSNYDFELFSNFTFFLRDSVNRDQIRQREDRRIFGLESVLNYNTLMTSGEFNLEIGVGLRNDQINDVGLSYTKNRDSTLTYIQRGDITESNYYAFVNPEFEFGSLTINPGVRLDYFQYLYQNALTPAYDPQNESKVFVSPKLNFIYNFSDNLQAYVKSGIGFHSNDTRLVIERPNNEEIIPLALGNDVGFTWKPFPRIIINGALWHLFLEQEFVYVGDEGVVEASGRTRRYGFDFGMRYQLNDWLYFNGDLNIAKPRSIDEPAGERFIPLAPSRTVLAGLSVQKAKLSGAINVRYLGDRPANEDQSSIAFGYTVVDLNATYDLGSFTFGVMVENVFDVDWNETQFDTESRIRLPNGNLEAEPVSEIHFTPGTPISIRGSMTYKF